MSLTPPTTATAVAAPDAGAVEEPPEEDPKRPRRRVASAKPEDPEAALRAALSTAAATSRPTRPKNPENNEPPKPKQTPREYYDEGIALVRARDYRGAVKMFKEAVRGSPTNAIYHRDLAKAHRLTGNTRHALWHYNKYKQFAPGAPDLESVRKYVGAPE